MGIAEQKAMNERKQEEKTEGAIEAEKLAEKTREAAESGQQVDQSGEKSQSVIEAEQIAERAKLAQEEQKQRAEQQAKQKEKIAARSEKKEAFKQAMEVAAAKLHFSLIGRVKAMRAQDEKLISEKKEAMREKADLQKMVAKVEKPGLKLERGGDEKKEIQPEIEKQFEGDLRGLGTTHSSGFGQMSKGVALDNFVPERALAGAGTEHLATYHGVRETPAPVQQSAQQAEVVSEKAEPAKSPTPAPVQQQQAEATTPTPAPTQQSTQQAEVVSEKAEPAEAPMPTDNLLQQNFAEATASNQATEPEFSEYQKLAAMAEQQKTIELQLAEKKHAEELAELKADHKTELAGVYGDQYQRTILPLQASDVIKLQETQRKEQIEISERNKFPDYEKWKNPSLKSANGEIRSEIDQEKFKAPPELSKTLRELSHSVDEKTNHITYHYKNEKIFVDEGKIISIKEQKSDAAVAAALATAQKKFGDVLDLAGPQKMLENAVRVAVENNLTCRFSNPEFEKTRQEMQTAKDKADGIAKAPAAEQTADYPAPEAQKQEVSEAQPETEPTPEPEPEPEQKPELELKTETEKKAEREQFDPRFGAEAIEGTQAYKDRDEADAERGRGYRETPADQVTDERIRDDDGYSDLVPIAKEAENEAENENGGGEGGSSAKEPKAQEAEKTAAPEPEPEYDYDDDYGR